MGVDELQDDLNEESKQRRVLGDMLGTQQKEVVQKSSSLISNLEASHKERVVKVEERLQQETSALRALESLVKSGLAEEAKERAERLQEVSTSASLRIRAVEESLTSLRSASDAQTMESEKLASNLSATSLRLDSIDKAVAEEVDNRIGGDKTVSKELGDQISAEAQRLNDTVLREMRERMEGQRTLREEMQVQQQALMRLSPRIDEAFIELQAELPRISQDVRSQKSVAEQMAKSIADAAMRVDQCEKGLADEVGARAAATKAVARDVRELVDSEASRTDTQLLAMQKKLQQEILAHVESTGQAAISTRALVDRVVTDVSDARDGLDRLVGQHDLAQEANKTREADVDRKLSSMQAWMESSVVQRVATLDAALRKETTERSTTFKQALDIGSHNAERWGQLQSKFDELLIESHKHNSLK